MNKPTTSKEIGQFFTPDYVANFMVSLSSVKRTAKVLEPSFGNGVFIRELAKAGFNNITGYEIDVSLSPAVAETKAKLLFQSFVSADLKEKFELVIGNPPYVRWKNLNEELKEELSQSKLWQRYFNSLCDYLYIFILKSVEMLAPNGELIFITPEYWINTKHAIALRNYLVENGYFTDIIHFNETPIFEKVVSSFIIFKFKKNKDVSKDNKIRVVKFHSKKKLTSSSLSKINSNSIDSEIESFERDQFVLNQSWLLIPDSVDKKLKYYENKCSITVPLLFESQLKIPTLGDIADIGNGMVSGLDKAFQLPENIELKEREKESTIQVLKAKNLNRFFYHSLSTYIFLEDKVSDEKELQKGYPNFYHHLKSYQSELENRYSYNKKYNYWDWVFLRSYNLFSKKQGRIFIPCKERISHKNFFRFSYVPEGIYPTQDVTGIFLKPSVKESIYYVLALLNSRYVFDWLKFKGVVKGNIVEFSEKPLASIPVRLINWQDEIEVLIHNKISELVKQVIFTKDEKMLDTINREIDKLL